MNKIASQIATLKNELKVAKGPVVADLIRAEIGKLERRLNGGKNRKAAAIDGGMVGVGDSVYQYQLPWSLGREPRPPKIDRYVVSEIIRSGKCKFEGHGWLGPVDISRKYYSSPAAAYKAMVTKATEQLKERRRSAAEAAEVLKIVRAFKANRPKKQAVAA